MKNYIDTGLDEFLQVEPDDVLNVDVGASAPLLLPGDESRRQKAGNELGGIKGKVDH